jgi:type IX secretion system PorP/SprF family membrane protein
MICSKFKFVVVFVLFTGFLFSQQAIFFSQYPMVGNLHSATMSGSNINNGPEAFVGRRVQSIGIPLAGESSFVTFNYTNKPNRSYKVWHNYSFSISNDKTGAFRKEKYYAGYNIHFFAQKRTVIALGLLAGVQNIAFERNIIDRADPIYARTSQAYFFVYPDIIPSFRVSRKSFFADFALHRVSVTKLKQGKNQIGNARYQTPFLVTTLGKKFKLNDNWVCVSNLMVVLNSSAIPFAEMSVLAYYNKRFGAGVSLKNVYSAGAIVQVRALKNLTMGLTYNYALNTMRSYAPSTIEFVVGLSPYIKEHAKDLIKHDVNRCPSFIH